MREQLFPLEFRTSMHWPKLRCIYDQQDPGSVPVFDTYLTVLSVTVYSPEIKVRSNGVTGGFLCILHYHFSFLVHNSAHTNLVFDCMLPAQNQTAES